MTHNRSSHISKKACDDSHAMKNHLYGFDLTDKLRKTEELEMIVVENLDSESVKVDDAEETSFHLGRQWHQFFWYHRDHHGNHYKCVQLEPLSSRSKLGTHEAVETRLLHGDCHVSDTY